MKITWKGKRLLALALALVLLLSMLPSSVPPVFSKEMDQTASENTEKHPDIGKLVKPLDFGYTQAYTDPTNWGTGKYVDSKWFPERLVITDVMVVGSTTYYQLSADEGCKWSQAAIDAEMGDGYWLESTKVKLLVPCDICGKLGCESSHENWCEICRVDDCTNDHVSATVTDSEGKEQTITVAGKLPEGAELKVTIPEINGEKHGNAFDIKVYAPNEQGELVEWQPINDGKTVTVSIPVEDVLGFGYVNINHFIDCAADIDGDENIVDISEATDEELALLNPAIEAYGDGTHVAIEVAERKKVSNGMVQVETDSFSLFTEVESPPTEVSTYVIEELNGQKLFVRPGEWFRLTTNQSALLVEGWDAGYAESDGTIRTIAGGGSRFLFWGSSENSFYVFTNENNSNNQSTVGSTYTISFTHTVLGWPPYKTYTVDVEVVEDFDWGSTYITLLPHTAGYPAEPSVYSDKGYQFYVDGALESNKNVHTMYPRTLIDVDALNDADVDSDVDRLVYGIADNTGKNTDVYLKDAFDPIATDMLAEYFVGKDTLIPENYKLVVYAIKHETVGANAGWYIHCKVELKDKFNLSYAYNEPSGFKAQTHLTSLVKLPEGTGATPTIDEDTGKPTATATVGKGKGMKMELPEGKTTYTADFVAWSTDPTADPSKYVKGVEGDIWYDEGDTIVMTEDTILWAIWTTTKPYTAADIRFQKLVETSDGDSYETNREFFFVVYTDHNGDGVADGVEKFIGLNYTIFGGAGQTIRSGTFAAGALNFTLKAGQYIVIYQVPNLEDTTAQYIIKETVPDEYSAPNDGVAYGKINSDTNRTGEFSLTFTNTVTAYEITYMDGETKLTNIGNPESYTFEDTMELLPLPNKTGFTFAGWYENADFSGEKITKIENSTGDKTLYAKWEVDSYTVTWIVDGVETVVPYEYGATIVKPADPSKEGHTFTGWDKEVPMTMPAKNLIFTAQFELGLTSLTIKVEGCDTEKDPNQAFLFTVAGTDGVKLQVTVFGDRPATISGVTIGQKYTIKMDDFWSWRYGEALPQEITIDSDAQKNVITFSLVRTNIYWLDGNNYHSNN